MTIPGDGLAVPPEVQLLCEVLRAGVEAVRPESCLPAHVRCVEDGDALVIQATDVRHLAAAAADPAQAAGRSGALVTAQLPAGARVAVLCVGKCALGSALTLRELLGERLARALIIDREQELPGPLPEGPPELELLAGDHPLPGERSLAAGRRARDFVAATLPGELLLVCLSGGASALMEQPARGVPVDWLAAVPAALMHAGADVHELLGARTALSALKGGGLLDRVPRGVASLVLVLSDVAGDDPAAVGGAPFFPILSASLRELLDAALARHGAHLPEPARAWLATTGRRRLRAQHVQPPPHVVVATNAMARAAARDFAASRGMASEDLGEHFGAPAEVAASLCAWAAGTGAPLGVMGGEAVAAVRGTGRGGPNLEVVAECLGACAAQQLRAVASIDTDGIDGSTELAGAVAWPAMAALLAPGVEAALRTSDSASLFVEVGGLRWRATGANVSDLRVVLR